MTEQPSQQLATRRENADYKVGCALAGSMLGVKLSSEGPMKAIRKRYTLRELLEMANRPTARQLAERSRQV